MKNSDCIIYITTKRGWTQRYVRESDGRTQTGPNGTSYARSAEQLLSHLLPRLAADDPGHVSVRVERRAEAADQPS